MDERTKRLTEGPESKFGRCLLWVTPEHGYGRIFIIIPTTQQLSNTSKKLLEEALLARINRLRKEVRERYPGWTFQVESKRGYLRICHLPLDMLEEIGQTFGTLINTLLVQYQDTSDPPIQTKEERIIEAGQRGWLRPLNEEEEKEYRQYCRNVIHFPSIILSVGGRSKRSGRIKIRYTVGEDDYCNTSGMALHRKVVEVSLQTAVNGYRYKSRQDYGQQISVFADYNYVEISNIPPELLDTIADHIAWHIRTYLLRSQETERI